MKCPKCRAEILANDTRACPYCGTPLNAPFERSKKIERAGTNDTKEIAEKIKEVIEAQKQFYKSEEAETPKKAKTTIKKKYSTTDIVTLFVSLGLTFIALAVILSLLMRR